MPAELSALHHAPDVEPSAGQPLDHGGQVADGPEHAVVGQKHALGALGAAAVDQVAPGSKVMAGVRPQMQFGPQGLQVRGDRPVEPLEARQGELEFIAARPERGQVGEDMRTKTRLGIVGCEEADPAGQWGVQPSTGPK